MSTSKPRMLLISAISPFPTDSGGAVRIKEELTHLHEDFRISAIFFVNTDNQLSRSDIQFLDKACEDWVNFPLRGSQQLQIALEKRIPYWFTLWWNPDLPLFLKKFFATHKVAVVQVEFSQLLYLKQYIPAAIPSVFVAHDVAEVSFWRRLKEIHQPLRRCVHFWRWLEVKLYEKKWAQQFTIVAALSSVDKKQIARSWGVDSKQILVVPNGTSLLTSKSNFVRKRKVRLGSIGSFDHTPNEGAFAYFVSKIVPELIESELDWEFHLAGTNTRSKAKKLLEKHTTSKTTDRILLHDFMDELDHFYDQVDILLVPLLSGSGTRIKILEALGRGKIVIASPVGAEGLEELGFPLLKVARTPAEYIEAIQESSTWPKEKFLENQQKMQQYSWKAIFKKYQQELKNVLSLP